MKNLETSNFIKNSLQNKEEKLMFGTIKRELLKDIVNPKTTDRIMIDVIGCEYVKYIRALQQNLPRIAIASAKAIREYLAELNLTPHSKTETDAGGTLSMIYKTLNKEEEDNA